MTDKSITSRDQFDAGPPQRRLHLRWIAGISVAALVLIVVVLLVAGVRLRDLQRRVQCKNYFMQMGLALHNYHDANGSLPPVFVTDSRGRARHSWRVFVLPYLDRASLAAAYRFEEPWDCPANSRLHSAGVPNFQCPSDRAEQPEGANWTSICAIVGPHTVWPAEGSLTLGEISDGTSNTIFLGEVYQSGIHWMEPRDLDVLQMSTTVNAAGGQGISSPHPGGAHVLLGDGSARFLSDETSPEILRRLIERDDGEPVDGF